MRPEELKIAMQEEDVRFRSAILTGMIEYFNLLNIAQRESTPLYEKRGILDIMSRMVIYMTQAEYEQYQQISLSVRGQLRDSLSPPAPCQK